MNKTYLICLRNIETQTQKGIWSLDTDLTGDEFAALFRSLSAFLSTQWSVTFWETKKSDWLEHEEMIDSPVGVLKKIIEVIKNERNKTRNHNRPETTAQ